MKIIQSRSINTKTGYLVIPFLESYYKSHKGSIYDMLATVIPIDSKYREICEKIDYKMKDKLINIATLTITKPSKTKSKTSKTTSKTRTTHTRKSKSITQNSIGDLLQIYIIRLDNARSSYASSSDPSIIKSNYIYL